MKRLLAVLTAALLLTPCLASAQEQVRSLAPASNAIQVQSRTVYGKLERKLLASYVLAAIEKHAGRANQAEQHQAKARSLKKKDINDFVTGTPNTQAPDKKVWRSQGKPVHGSLFGTGKK